ncbi:MAG: HEAT repeat domain-containing protein [Planctomycetes bacterium]|nr:HEAT repeat domain-containing protein [Planctomycetota bacterium]
MKHCREVLRRTSAGAALLVGVRGLALWLLLGPSAAGHGGAYRGPGDFVPSGASAGASGGTSGTGSTSNGGTVAPSGPAGQPTGPSTPVPQPSISSGAASSAGPDGSRWQTWWGFNKDAFLSLRARVGSGGLLAGSDVFFLSRREPTQDELQPTPQEIHDKVKPALRAALSVERQNDVQSGLIVALAKLGDRPGETEVAGWIAPFLAHPNQELAETTAVALGILGNERELDFLRAILDGDAEALRARGVGLEGPPSERTRAFAAFGLGLVGHRSSGVPRERAVEALVAWMGRESARAGQAEIPVACITALGLIALPSDPLAAVAQNVGSPLRVTSIEEQLAWLAWTLERRDLSPRVRAHVPVAMARLMRVESAASTAARSLAVERIAVRLSRELDEAAEVRLGCVIALGLVGKAGEGALDVRVRERLRHVHETLRDVQAAHFALIALAQVSAQPGSGARPLAALEEGKDGTRAFLLERLSSGASSTRCYAALALGVLERGAAAARAGQSAEVLAALRKALEDARAPDEVGAFALALGLAQDSASIASLRKQFEAASDVEARGHVAVALGLVGDRASIRRIQEIVVTSKYRPDLLRNAALALGLLGDKEIVPQLVQMLRNSTGLAARAAIASALGLIGDRRTLEPLLAMLGDRESCTDLSRAFAAVALGMCCDKELLPWNAKLAADSNYRSSTSTLYSPDTGTGILDIL